LALGGVKKGFQAVGERLIRAKDPEIPLLAVQLRDIAQETPEHMRVADAAHPWRGHVNCVVAEIRHPQIAEQNAAIGVGVRAHAPVASGRKFGQFRLQAALLIEEFLRSVAPQPVFQQLEVFGMGGRVGERHLMRSEGAFNLQAIDRLRPRPALGRSEHDHRPARTPEFAMGAGVLLDFLDLLDRRIERRGHRLVHQIGLVTLDEVGRPAIAAEQLFQFLAGDAGEHSRVGNLVAVEMQDRQHRAVGYGIEELVRMPGGGQRTRFRLAIADDAGDDEIGIVEYRPKGMAERIAQLAALVDRTRALRRCVTWDSSGKRKLNKKLPKPGLVLADIGVDLAVSAL
jgi:hypothetical protein